MNMNGMSFKMQRPRTIDCHEPESGGQSGTGENGPEIFWPDNRQCAVVFTIHVDGESLYNRGPVPIPRSESYGTYGPARAVDRILGDRKSVV